MTSPSAAGRIFPRRGELRSMLRLAIPVVIVQVGMMLMGVVDTVMVGHMSPDGSSVGLAAVALGHLYFFGIGVFGMGTLMVLDPVVAQAVGARDEAAVARGMQRGVLLAVMLAVPSVAILLAAGPVLGWARQPAEVVPLAAAYTVWLAPGVLPFFLFIVFRQSLQAFRRTASIVVAIVVANLVNAALNWALIFGHGPFGRMGVLGSAWATTASRWLLLAVLVALAWREIAPRLRQRHPEVWDSEPLLRMVRLGVPIGLQYVLEFGAFACVALLMGWLGTRQMAGHQVAINLASLTFMVPLGVGDAASVLVGHAVGRADATGARGAARAALICGAGFMCCTALVFLIVPNALARFYTSDVAVVTIAAGLIPLAGVFQVFDGLQVVAGGILRGLGETRVAMLVNLLGYWLLGLPVSWLLGIKAGWGPVGLWWGLVLGLAVVATVLLVRVRIALRRQRTRVVIDQAAALAEV
ncbi:MAG: MATE family efflux transporter [Gemmatimonadales bacterium]|nr:MATE family efflux transporter [Gemmatimonadales bacterium]